MDMIDILNADHHKYKALHMQLLHTFTKYHESIISKRERERGLLCPTCFIFTLRFSQ